ncbi:MAG: hypothetical protein WBL61_17155 [Bryobacteraceae bacterium]
MLSGVAFGRSQIARQGNSLGWRLLFRIDAGQDAAGLKVPITLVEHTFPVFLFAPSGVTWQSISAVLDKLEKVKAELFAAQLAEIKGLNPDRPRMLQKITRTM